METNPNDEITYYKIRDEMIINDKENELEILCSSLNNFINIYSDSLFST
jgi:hypothetical protein